MKKLLSRLFFVFLFVIVCLNPVFSTSQKETKTVVNAKEDFERVLKSYYSTDLDLIEEYYYKFIRSLSIFTDHAHYTIETDSSLLSLLDLDLDVLGDTSWIKNMIIDIDSNVLGDKWSIDMKLNINGVEIMKGYLYFDFTEGISAFSVPTVSDRYYYLETDISSELNFLVVLAKSLPTKDEFRNMLNGFIDYALHHIENVEKKSGVSIPGVTGSVFDSYKFSLSPESYSDIFRNFFDVMINEFFGEMLKTLGVDLEEDSNYLDSYLSDLLDTYNVNGSSNYDVEIWFDSKGLICRFEICSDNEPIASMDMSNGRDFTSFTKISSEETGNSTSSFIKGTINDFVYNLAGNIVSKSDENFMHADFSFKNLVYRRELSYIQSGDLDFDYLITVDQTNIPLKEVVSFESRDKNNGSAYMKVTKDDNILDFNVDYSYSNSLVKFNTKSVISYDSKTYPINVNVTIDSRSKITSPKKSILPTTELSKNLNYLGLMVLLNSLNKAGYSISDITQYFFNN